MNTRKFYIYFSLTLALCLIVTQAMAQDQDYEKKAKFETVDHGELKRILDRMIRKAEAINLRVTLEEDFMIFRGIESEVERLIEILTLLDNGRIDESGDQLDPVIYFFKQSQEAQDEYQPYEVTIKLRNGVTQKIQELTQMYGGGFSRRGVRTVLRNGTTIPPLQIILGESLG